MEVVADDINSVAWATGNKDHGRNLGAFLLKELSLGDRVGELGENELVTLFKAIDETNNLKLKALNLPNEDFSEVPPEVLAAALVKLEETDILTAPLNRFDLECL